MQDDNLLKDLVSSLIEERKNERKYKLFFRASWFVLFIIVIFFLVFMPLDKTMTGEDHTAIIEINVNLKFTLKRNRCAKPNTWNNK